MSNFEGPLEYLYFLNIIIIAWGYSIGQTSATFRNKTQLILVADYDFCDGNGSKECKSNDKTKKNFVEILNFSDRNFVDNPTELDILNFTGNSIPTFTRKMFNGHSFGELVLVNNFIQAFENEAFVGQETRLREITFSQNMPAQEDATPLLTVWPSQPFSQLSQLTKLTVRLPLLTSIDQPVCSGCHNLQHLTLVVDNIKQLDPNWNNGFQTSLKHLKFVTKTEVIHNLTSLLGGFSNLENLRISVPNLKHVEKSSFKQLTLLKHLELVDTGIETMDDGVFANLEHLKTLDLRSNNIQHLNRCLENLSQLEELNISNNLITSLTAKNFKNLERLITLDATINMIAQIEPGTYLETPRLKNLKLGQNLLSDIKAGTFDGLVNLEKLNLSQSRVMVIEPGVFDSLGNLRDLYLDRNKISELDKGAFAGVSQLEHLDLSQNALDRTFFKSLIGLSYLHVLNVSHNNLNSFDADTLKNLEKLDVFDIKENPLICDERQDPFIQWSKSWAASDNGDSHRQILISQGKCAGPDEVKNLSIIELPNYKSTNDGNNSVSNQPPITSLSSQGTVKLEATLKLDNNIMHGTTYHSRLNVPIEVNDVNRGKKLKTVRRRKKRIIMASGCLVSLALITFILLWINPNWQPAFISSIFGRRSGKSTHSFRQDMPSYTEQNMSDTRFSY